jgi:hypothetical protein
LDARGADAGVQADGQSSVVVRRKYGRAISVEHMLDADRRGFDG